jgi:hypothetical protein
VHDQPDECELIVYSRIYTNPNEYASVIGDSAWKLPYNGKLYEKIEVDETSGYVLSTDNELNFELSLTITPYIQLASQAE